MKSFRILFPPIVALFLTITLLSMPGSLEWVICHVPEKNMEMLLMISVSVLSYYLFLLGTAICLSVVQHGCLLVSSTPESDDQYKQHLHLSQDQIRSAEPLSGVEGKGRQGMGPGRTLLALKCSSVSVHLPSMIAFLLQLIPTDNPSSSEGQAAGANQNQNQNQTNQPVPPPSVANQMGHRHNDLNHGSEHGSCARDRDRLYDQPILEERERQVDGGRESQQQLSEKKTAPHRLSSVLNLRISTSYHQLPYHHQNISQSQSQDNNSHVYTSARLSHPSNSISSATTQSHAKHHHFKSTSSSNSSTSFTPSPSMYPLSHPSMFEDNLIINHSHSTNTSNNTISRSRKKSISELHPRRASIIPATIPQYDSVYKYYHINRIVSSLAWFVTTPFKLVKVEQLWGVFVFYCCVLMFWSLIFFQWLIYYQFYEGTLIPEIGKKPKSPADFVWIKSVSTFIKPKKDLSKKDFFFL
jgi:hypothetical protein